MGYAIVPNIKNEVVVCQKPCEHRDCAAIRKDFIDNMTCKICGKPLEIGDKFYYCQQGNQDKVHMICEIERSERPVSSSS